MEKLKKITPGGIITEPGNTIKHNTGDWRTFKPVRDAKKCIKCGICWMFCPDGCINKDFEADLHHCKGCGICAEECPVKCIKMVKEEK